MRGEYGFIGLAGTFFRQSAVPIPEKRTGRARPSAALRSGITIGNYFQVSYKMLTRAAGSAALVEMGGRMVETIVKILARELGKEERHIINVIALLDEGSTIPFIARYRKELHGSMDDTALRTLEDRLHYLRSLQQRREEVLSAIENQGKLTEELTAAVHAAATLAEVEDLYRPYKPKRRTRATIARERGLEPLALLLMAQEKDGPVPLSAAADFIDPEKGVETAEDALQGASDIAAEIFSDDAAIRKSLRELPL